MRRSVFERAGAWPRALCVGASLLWLGHTAAATEVTQPIEQLDTGLLQAMKAGKTAPFRQRYDQLAPFVTRAVDLDSILQAGVGAGWAALPADQKAALKAAFQHYSIATYVSNFDEFGGERFDLLPPAAGADPVVKVKIVPGKAGDDIHTLAYTMRQTADGWKATDVKADGTISQVAAQQEQIRSLVKSGGTAGLLARLQQKTAELSGGTVH
jgi:phospholipid transport system substrate-binding protein